MIRYLLIVLMFALPAQFAWAAAAGYCAHESDPVSLHVGHHVHEHRASLPDSEATDADSSPEPAKSPLAQGHADCSYCHAVVAQFAAPQPSMLGPPPRDVFVASGTVFPCSGIGNDIDRPQWTPAG